MQIKLSIDKNKLIYILVDLIMIFIHILKINEMQPSNVSLKKIAMYAILAFAIGVYQNYRLTGNVISMTNFFLAGLFLFAFGQSTLWIFNIEDIERDVLESHSAKTVYEGLRYSLLCLDCFILSVIFFAKNVRKQLSSKKRLDKSSQLYGIAKIFAVVSCVPFLMKNLFRIIISLTFGYVGVYSISHPLFSHPLLLFVADWFEPAIIALLISTRGERRHKFYQIILVLCALAKMIIGGRSIALVIIMVLILDFYSTKSKKMRIKDVLLVLSCTILLMLILNVVQSIRSEGNKNLQMVYEAINGEIKSGGFITDIFAEFGWSISPLLYTMEAIPYKTMYRYGATYWYSLLGLIPNLGFWSIHPAKVNASLADWLDGVLNTTSQPGYSFIAETYINFAFYGCILFILFGFLISKCQKVLSSNQKKTAMSEFLVYAVIYIGLVEFSRGCFLNLLRAFEFRIVPMVVLYYLLQGKIILRSEKC